MREHRAKSGRLIYYATRHELETLPGYRGTDQKGRACCPIHAGDNPTALSIDWRTGWASCWSCGDAWSIHVEDPSETNLQHHLYGNASRNVRNDHLRDSVIKNDSQSMNSIPGALLENLEGAIMKAAERLMDSPGATYLSERGIPLDVAQRLRLGWSTTGKLAGRVVFPLCNPDGTPTSAIGRAITDQVRPKYKALGKEDGYVKTLFNGGAIVQARHTGHPLVIVEGPMDAAACVAAGVPLVVALCGAAYAYPEHFGGLQTVILALDADETGQDARRTLWLELVARGVEVLPLPAAALDECKDLGEYWQLHRALPVQIAARVMGPHLRDVLKESEAAPQEPIQKHVGTGTPMEAATSHACVIVARREEMFAAFQQQATEALRSLPISPDDLAPELKADAEWTALELSNIYELGAFVKDLLSNEHTLSPEDCCAAWYAISCAMKVFHPSPAA
ncbi:MAG: toprim domain-containing protein [Thermomicrobiales bacterium]